MDIKVELKTCCMSGFKFVSAVDADTNTHLGNYDTMETLTLELDNSQADNILYSSDFNFVNDDDLRGQYV